MSSEQQPYQTSIGRTRCQERISYPDNAAGKLRRVPVPTGACWIRGMRSRVETTGLATAPTAATSLSTQRFEIEVEHHGGPQQRLTLWNVGRPEVRKYIVHR